MTLVPTELQPFVIPAVIGVLALATVLLGVALRRRGQQSAEMGHGELQLRRIMDNSPEALMILDVTAGHFSVLNERAVQLYGWPMEKLLTMSVADVSPPLQPDGRTSLASATEKVQEAIDGGQPVFPWSHLNSRGEIIPCEVRLIRIPHQNRVLVRGSVVDISARLRTEDKLRRSEERFRDVVDAQSELLYRWLPDGTRTFVNGPFCRYFASSEEKLLGVNFLDELDEKDRQRITANVRALNPGSPVIVSEVRVPLAEGRVAWLEWTDTGLFDGQGKLVEVQSIGRDITERKSVELDLEYTRSLLSTALEQTPAGIIIAEAPDGRIYLANEAVLEILGATEEDLEDTLAKMREDGYYREDGTRILPREMPLVRALSDGQTTTGELRLCRPDGQQRWISNSAAPVKNASGEIVAAIVVSTDITESKRAQMAIRSMVESVSAVTGKDFFEALVLQLSRVLSVDLAIVGERVEGAQEVRTLAMCLDGELSTPLPVFDSHDTPSGAVMRAKRRLVCHDVQRRFPADRTLDGHEFADYIGVPLFSPDSEAVGVLGIFSRAPMDRLGIKIDIMELFATRAASELERGRAARFLAQSEERFRTAFEEAPVGSIIIDRDGFLRRVNNTLCGLLGYAREEFEGKRLRELMHLDERPAVLANKEKMLTGEIERVVGERRMLHKDGGTVWVNYSARVMPDPTGERFFLVMVEDISIRKRAQESLEASRELQRIVAEVSAGFVGSGAEEVDRKIENALRRVGQFLSLDRIVLYTIGDGRARATHSWLRDGGEPGRPLIRTEDMPVASAQVLRGEIFRFSSIDELPDDASAEREVFSELGVKSWLGIPIQLNRFLAGILALATVHSEHRWPESMMEWLRVFGEMLANVIARRQAENELRANMELQQLVAEISATFVGAAAAEMDGRIQEALRRVGEFLQVDRVSLYRLTEDHAQLLHSWHDGELAPPFKELSLTNEVPFLARASRSGKIVSFSSMDEVGEDIAVEREVFARLGTRSFLAIPLLVGEALIGTFTLATVNTERRWPDNLVQWMRVFGEILGGAVARKAAEESQNASRRQLRGLTHQLTRAEDQERRRCATYLHDQISQTLAVMRMRFGELLGPGSEQEKQACIDEIRGLLEKTIEDTQTLTFDLSPPVLYDLGLVAAIEWVGEKICKEHGVEMELQVVGSEKQIPRDSESSSILFRAVRELLVNVVKHGKASKVDIHAEFTKGGVQITVGDNGIGFDTAVLDPNKGMNRFGLFSIRERLDFIGGSFAISSRPGSGTQVTLKVPVEMPLADSGRALR